MVEGRRAALLVVEDRFEALHPPRSQKEGGVGVLTGQFRLRRVEWRAAMERGESTEILRRTRRIVGEAEAGITPGAGGQGRLAETGQLHTAGAAHGDAVIGEAEQRHGRDVA